MPNLIKKTTIRSELCSNVYMYSEVSSTNNIAKKFIKEKNQIGFVIVAERQSAGKGQGGRIWESPRGGLWTSLAIQPQIKLSQLGIVPILSAVGISKALETFGINTLLKKMLITGWDKTIIKTIGGIIIIEIYLSARRVVFLILLRFFFELSLEIVGKRTVPTAI